VSKLESAKAAAASGFDAQIDQLTRAKAKDKFRLKQLREYLAQREVDLQQLQQGQQNAETLLGLPVLDAISKEDAFRDCIDTTAAVQHQSERQQILKDGTILLPHVQAQAGSLLRTLTDQHLELLHKWLRNVGVNLVSRRHNVTCVSDRERSITTVMLAGPPASVGAGRSCPHTHSWTCVAMTE
jgi:hypothetical protein